MAKKTRIIPKMVLTINGDGEVDVNSIINNDVFSKAVYQETLAGINDAINNKRKTAVLFTISNTEMLVELNKQQWIPALESCLKWFEKDEQYEMCIDIKTLIDKIK
jgi:uncharacterized protein (UPF0303 family)